MSQLLQISGFKFVAILDGVDITPEMRRDALNKKSYADFPYEIIDWDTSEAIEAYLVTLCGGLRKFENHAAVPYPVGASDDKYTYVYPEDFVDSNDVPELIRDSGLQIQRQKQIAYLIDDPENPNDYKMIDKEGGDINIKTAGSFRKNIITINDIVLAVPHADYNDIERVVHGDTKAVDDASEKLLKGAILVDEWRNKESIYTFVHELKHTKNNLLIEYGLLNQKGIKLSAFDLYRLEVDNEISARLAEVFHGIEIFQRRGKTENLNFKDLSVFSPIYNVWSYMMEDFPNINMEKTFDLKKIVQLTFDYYMKSFMDEYRKQYACLMERRLYQYPLDCLAKTSDDAGYKQMRSLYYNFSVYNPATGNYINMDLSEYVPEIDVPQDDKKKIQDVQVSIDMRINRDEDNKEHMQHNQKVGKDIWRNIPDFEVVADAVEMQRAAVADSPYGRRMAGFADMGLSVGAAMDWRPGMNIVAKDMEILGVPIENPVEKNPPKAFTVSEKMRDFWKRAITKVKKKANCTVAKDVYRGNDRR